MLALASGVALAATKYGNNAPGKLFGTKGGEVFYGGDDLTFGRTATICAALRATTRSTRARAATASSPVEAAMTL